MIDNSSPTKLKVNVFETPIIGKKYSPVARASAAIAAENPTINEIHPLKTQQEDGKVLLETNILLQNG